MLSTGGPFDPARRDRIPLVCRRGRKGVYAVVKSALHRAGTAGFSSASWPDTSPTCSPSSSRLPRAIPPSADVRVVSPGLRASALRAVCEAERWSYLGTATNDVSLAQSGGLPACGATCWPASARSAAMRRFPAAGRWNCPADRGHDRLAGRPRFVRPAVRRSSRAVDGEAGAVPRQGRYRLVG